MSMPSGISSTTTPTSSCHTAVSEVAASDLFKDLDRSDVQGTARALPAIGPYKSGYFVSPEVRLQVRRRQPSISVREVPMRY